MGFLVLALNFLWWCELMSSTNSYKNQAVWKYQTDEWETILIREYASWLQLLYSGNNTSKPEELIYFNKWFFITYPLKVMTWDKFEFKWENLFAITGFACQKDLSGNYTECDIWTKKFKRKLFPSESWETFKIVPIKPIEEVKQEAMSAIPPVENGEFLSADLVELVDLYSEFKLDIKYATKDNFMGEQMYPEARAFLQRPAAEALINVAQQLKELWFGIIVYDAYRPWFVTKMFWDSTPESQKNFVADPNKWSRHNRGGAVDVGLYDLQSGEIVEMISGFDEFSERAYPNYPGGTTKARWNKDILIFYMEKNGFTVNDDERWHFDYQWWEKYRINNIGFDEIVK